MLMGSPSNDQPILPTEVVLGSSRMHKKSSQRSSNKSELDQGDVAVETEVEQRIEFRALSWITFPSVASSQRQKSSVSEADVVVDPKISENKNFGDGLRSLEEEIGLHPRKNTCWFANDGETDSGRCEKRCFYGGGNGSSMGGRRFIGDVSYGFHYFGFHIDYAFHYNS